MTTDGRVLPGLLDTEAIRKDFPALDRLVHDGRKLVYLDNAATSQKPRQVLDTLNSFYERSNANVHRGVHVLAEEATALSASPDGIPPSSGATRRSDASCAWSSGRSAPRHSASRATPAKPPLRR